MKLVAATTVILLVAILEISRCEASTFPLSKTELSPVEDKQLRPVEYLRNDDSDFMQPRTIGLVFSVVTFIPRTIFRLICAFIQIFVLTLRFVLNGFACVLSTIAKIIYNVFNYIKTVLRTLIGVLF